MFHYASSQICPRSITGDCTHLVRREEEDIGTGRIHLVTLTRVNCLLLHSLDLQWLQLLVKHLAQIHDDTLVDLLPQVSTEDLNQTDLQRRNLSVPAEIISHECRETRTTART